jgi:hypothetical protein
MVTRNRTSKGINAAAPASCAIGKMNLFIPSTSGKLPGL